MNRRFAALALAISLVSTVLLAAPVAAAGPSLPLPASIAAVGDSITQAASTAGTLGADAPQNSWATGTTASVNSHYLRLRALNPSVTANNLSVSGAKMVNLASQMTNVVAVKPDYLTVLMGGNDLCTDTVGQMTSVADFRAQFATAMASLAAGSPQTRVYVSSIPNVYQLWNLFKGNWWARFIWAAAGICQSLLANPTSTLAADVQRRAQVSQRNVDFNTQLAQVCAQYATTCFFDGNAAFNTTFTSGDVSGDYFHPSVAGQAKLASVSWGAGYTWTPTTPANRAPTAVIGGAPSQCTMDVACNGFSSSGSSDPDGDPLTYTWAFGDGTSASGATASHTYTSAADSPYTVTLTVSDGKATGSATTSVAVVPPPANQPPIASFSASCTGLTCGFTDASSDPGGSVIARSWTFGDNGTSSATNPSHTYASGGTYTVTLSVTDNQGATASASQEVTVTAPPPLSISSLTGSGTAGKGSWTATVTVSVVSGSLPVAGAIVTGTWSSGSGSCTTSNGGACTISTNVNKKTTATTFTVTGVTKSGYLYTNPVPAPSVIVRP